MKHRLFSVGSGSTYAYGVLDTGYRFDMADEDAYELGRRAIVHATHRDAFSGGMVRGAVFLSLSRPSCVWWLWLVVTSPSFALSPTVYHIQENGWKHIGNRDVTELIYEYMPPAKDADVAME